MNNGVIYLRAMKALLVSEYWKPKVLGGGEISAGLMAKSLAESGVDVSVLTSYFKGSARYEEAEGVKIYRRLSTGGGSGSILSNIKRAILFSDSVERELPKLDKERDFDIIHALNITSLVGVSRAKDKLRKPIVAHVNSPTPFCPRGILLKGDEECGGDCDFSEFFSCLQKFGTVSKMRMPFYLRYNPFTSFLVYGNFKRKKEALKKFDCFMPISTFMKKMLLSYGISEDKIAVIPNIVETESFFDVKAEKHPVPGILYLGPYAEFKGPQILLWALKDIKSGYFCSLYGSGYFEEKLKNFVKDNGLAKVKINPEVPHSKVPDLYRQHDILVFPSLVSEAFGRVAIEAMAAGKPVVASSIGGVTDIVEDAKTGFLVKPGDIEGLRKALERLISDEKLRENMGREGRKSVEERYNADAITKKILKIYAEAVR